MIWLYIALIGWGILLYVAAHKGGEKEYKAYPTPHDEQVAWMIPVNLTAGAFVTVGVIATIYETGRIYWGWV